MSCFDVRHRTMTEAHLAYKVAHTSTKPTQISSGIPPPACNKPRLAVLKAVEGGGKDPLQCHASYMGFILGRLVSGLAAANGTLAESAADYTARGSLASWLQ